MGHKTDPVSSSPLLLLLLLFLLPLLLLPVVLGLPNVSRERREDTKDGAEDSKKLLDQMLSGVERAMDFFAQDYSSINVDGLFGMRVAQGQLMGAKKACESSGSCPEGLQRRLQAVIDRIETAAQAALKYVKAEDEDYYAKFVQVVDRPYLLPYSAVTLQDLKSTPPGSNPSYEEETGDACLSRVMGTFVDGALGRAVDRCNVTDECWTYMTAPGSCRYAITHQLLYLSFIQKNGCTQSVEAAMNAQVAHAQARMCGAIYNEAVSEVKDDKVADIFQDLFLEQVIVCGTLGYENFLRSDWMRMVLTWQKASGCFSVDDVDLLQQEMNIVKEQEKQRQIMTDLKHEALVLEQRQSTGRKLLRERIMQDGCLSHKSGLGFGAMGVFVRYLVQHDFVGN